MLRRIVFLLVAIVLLIGGIYVYAHRVCNPVPVGTMIDRIVVEKSARKLSIFAGDKQLKSYRVALARNPIGAKEEEGDMKTPEGLYWIDWRNPESDYHLSLHVSYPSEEDNARAAKRGVNAGFDIMVHGIRNGGGWIGAFHRTHDWTAGCIALSDEEIEELYRVTPDWTPIEIRP
jgi:murein L,D-transpeptidase YafK